MSSATAPLAASSSSLWKAPAFIQNFYAKFPLVVLEQEDQLSWQQRSTSGKGKSKVEGVSCSLWIDPPPSASSSNPHLRTWPSTSPSSLRTQLLFLLRSPGPKVAFKSWSNPNAAPGGKLPALHLVDEGRLLGSDEIRGWLDAEYPIGGKGKKIELNGMPNQEAYDRALAIAPLILGHLYPAYLASLPEPPADLHLLFPTPPPLSAGLSTPLPASMTGDKRDINIAECITKGVGAIDALDTVLNSAQEWALGARSPTPLDALITAHLYPIYSLSTDSALLVKLQQKNALGEYIERVLSEAERSL